MANKVNSASSQIHSLEDVLMRQKSRIALACANRLFYQSDWLRMHLCKCVLEFSSVCFPCSACLSVFAFTWVIGIGIRRGRKRRLHVCKALLCALIFLLHLVKPLACPPLRPNTHTHTHWEWDNHFALYPPQYEIMPFQTSLTSLTIDVSAEGGGGHQKRIGQGGK